ncbi:hypothetical protein QBC42DRAFT_285029 [Cladorrhinum samala]|uniref:GED domain-containing protein n=1 Tax=Cladorrhinum samala TaxID=585594 RepID=A0AAV9HVW5_9PEZI|nr:hypothetical protein QBC42DRAFT_285029 [Cladorrhinum samala]
MGVDQKPDAAQSPNLHSLSHLLNVIDRLNEVGLGIVNLPRIVIVGDSPAAKRTVWEAIIGIPIPSMEGLNDCSELEVVLAQSAETRVNLSIEGQSVEGFPTIGFDQDDDLPALLEEIIRRIRVIGFDSPPLSLEIRGPGMPNLTLVDLPYLYDMDDGKTQLDQADGREITYRQFVDECMRQKNNIILPVVPAKRGFGVPGSVLSLVKQYDQKYDRTFGIVAVSDDISDEGELQSKFLKLAQNYDSSHSLGLGWHVLPDPLREQDIAVKLEHKDPDADEPEQNGEVLKEDPWSVIKPHYRGAKHLRQRLEARVLERIRRQFSKATVTRIQQMIAEHQTRIQQLASPLAYMTRINLSFHDLAREALRGSYTNEFFGELYTGTSSSSYEDSRVVKFRALVRDLNNAFGYVMVTSGRKRDIVLDSGHHQGKDDSGADGMVPSHLEPLIDLYDIDSPTPVFVNDLERELEQIAPENQGTGFSGSVHDTVILRLFRDQIGPWEKIATRHLELTTHFARRFAEKLVSHLTGCDTKTASALIKTYVGPYFEKKSTELSAKLEELLHHYKHGYGTQPLYTNGPGLACRRRNKGAFGGQPSNRNNNALVAFGAPSAGQQSNTRAFGVDQIIDNMMEYYDIAFMVFIDNVTTLAVENCLVRDIPNILSAVNSGLDKEAQKIAAESREKLQGNLETLQSLLATCQRLLPQESDGGISGSTPRLRPPIKLASRSRATSGSPQAALAPSSLPNTSS